MERSGEEIDTLLAKTASIGTVLSGSTFRMKIVNHIGQVSSQVDSGQKSHSDKAQDKSSGYKWLHHLPIEGVTQITECFSECNTRENGQNVGQSSKMFF